MFARKPLCMVAAAAALGTPTAQALPISAGGPSVKLERVTVSRTAGQLSFAVRLAAPADLAGSRVQIMLDVDRNPSTGIQGSEHALDYSAAAGGGPAYASVLSLQDWQLVESQPASLQLTTTPSSITFRISPAALGDPAAFDFWVFASRGNTVVDTLPAGVSSAAAPTGWTFPAGAGAVSYSDAADGALSAGEIALATLVVAALAASIGFVARRVSKGDATDRPQLTLVPRPPEPPVETARPTPDRRRHVARLR